MSTLDPQKQREFAVEVVRQLREHGFDAYWAGGCVRDHLLGRKPVDYDVATSAHPEEIRGVFKKRKTLSIGAAFGVMTVLGPRSAGQIEVATFRQDVSYSDGRHPDRVEFSSPQEDAQRRDFTINGMFYDPLAEQVVDYVGGEVDLRQGLVRAIGDASARFTEDKLRMLRAVRFTAVFGFQLERETLQAMCEMAPQVTVVSAERIADEMRTTLVHSARVRTAQLLNASGLLAAIMPEAAAVAEREKWPREVSEDGGSTVVVNVLAQSPTLALLNALEEPSFPLALAALLHTVRADNLAETIGARWKLARAEIERLVWLLAHQNSLTGARSLRWSQLQPLLVDGGAEDLVKLYSAKAELGLAAHDDLDYVREKLNLPAEQLNPAPVLTGNDLLAAGIPAGPVFAKLLRAVRDAQLDGEVNVHAAALEMAKRMWHEKQM
jgi:poly(A) polymerase